MRSPGWPPLSLCTVTSMSLSASCDAVEKVRLKLDCDAVEVELGGCAIFVVGGAERLRNF